MYLIILSIYDIRSLRVPAGLLTVGGATAAGAAVYEVCMTPESWPAFALSLLPGIILLAAAAISGKVGYGDGAVLMMVGLLAGVGKCVYIFLLSLILTAVVSGILLALHRIKRTTKIPYIPFIAAGCLLIIYFGD